MNARLANLSIPLLRWTLGLVVIIESSQFAFSASAAHFFAKAGLPSWLRPALGGSEILAAILFLVPFTALLGGYLLLVIFGAGRSHTSSPWSIWRRRTACLRRGSAGVHGAQEQHTIRGSP